MWFVELLKVIIWPALVGGLVWVFHPQLKLLLGRIKEGKILGVELMLEAYKASEFEQTVSAYMPGASWLGKQATSAEITVELSTRRLASYYFMAHDLTLCWSAVVSGAPRNMIVHTLTCAIDHSGKIGLSNTPFHGALVQILGDAKATKDADWTPELRRIEGRKLWTIARKTGDLLLQIFPDRPASSEGR
jgi:hypothetical protein